MNLQAQAFVHASATWTAMCLATSELALLELMVTWFKL